MDNTNDADVRCERLRNLLGNMWVLPDILNDVVLLEDIKDAETKRLIDNILSRIKVDKKLLEVALDPTTPIDKLKTLYHDK